MFSEQKSVIGGDDQHGVVPQIMLVHCIEDLAEVGVTHTDECGVFVPHVVHLVSWVIDSSIGGPVKMRTVIFVGIEVLIRLLSKKWLVRIERLDL